MLDIFAKIAIELANLILKVKDRNPNYKRSAKAMIKLHWNLLKLEEHSKLFIERLEVLLKEKRISSRLYWPLQELQKDAIDLYKMLDEDTWGNGRHPNVPGFWGIIAVFDKSIYDNLHKILGFKCRRLEYWSILLDKIVKKNKAVEKNFKLFYFSNDWPLDVLGDTFNVEFSPILYDVIPWSSINKVDLNVLDLNDRNQLLNELSNSKVVVTNIKKVRNALSGFIKENYDIKDLF